MTSGNKRGRVLNLGGRSPEFQRYLSELWLTDPAAVLQINGAERQYLTGLESRVNVAELTYLEQFRGPRQLPFITAA